jgi:hypothetical protein
MRICDKCEYDNGEAQSENDLWCAQCRNFLGLPVQTRLHRRRVAVRLVDTHASVEPGSEARLTALVRNCGEVVEKVRFTVAGGATGWTAVEPGEVGLFPHQEAEIRVLFRPPRASQTRSGLTPFRLTATSEADMRVSDTAEGTVDVGSFVELRAALDPLRSTASSGGAHHRLALSNDGNTPATIVMTASQPGDDLALAIKPRSLELAPGARGEAHFDVEARHPLFSGPDKTHPFSIGVAAPGQTPITIAAQHVQQPVPTAPTLVLADERLTVAPGDEISTTVTIRNRGRGGDDYSLELLGPAAQWGRVTPPVVALPSAGEVDVKVVFAPPLSPQVLQAEIPFAVGCRSQVDSTRSVVAEAVLSVAPVSDIRFEIRPKEVRSRWSSRHVIDVENRGNTTTELRPVIMDAEHHLSYAVSPSHLCIPASNRDLVVLKARARHPRLLSKPCERSLQVSLVPSGPLSPDSREDEERRAIKFEQLPILPRGLTALMIFITLVAAVVGTGLLIFGDQINQWW